MFEKPSGEAVRRLRESAGLSLEDAAELAMVRVEVFERWEAPLTYRDGMPRPFLRLLELQIERKRAGRPALVRSVLQPRPASPKAEAEAVEAGAEAVNEAEACTA